MPRRVREYVEVEDHLSLNKMVEKLTEIQGRLPADCFPELRLSGDDMRGRSITITYFRDMTQAEADDEARYAAATLQAMEVKIDRLREQLEIINSLHFRQPSHRAVA